MGTMFSSSWVASRRGLCCSGVFLLCAVLGVGLCRAEQLRGVLYFDELGNGAYPSGTTKLAVGTRMYTLEYGDPDARRFSNPVCSELGAVWSVTIGRHDGSPYVRRAACSGEVDENVHGPWLVVRDYLARLSDSEPGDSFLSLRWRSSPGYRSLASKIENGSLKVDFNPVTASRCIEVERVEPREQTRLAATCSIERDGEFVFLVFNVVRNLETQQWEIDDIVIE
jgi:hypothetical protein